MRRLDFCWALLPAFLATPVLAAPPLQAAVGLTTDVITHRSYDLVDTNDHFTRGFVSAGYALRLREGNLNLDLTYSGGATFAPLHLKTPARLALQTLELGASFHYPWFRHLEPYARLGAGVGWATLELEVANGPARQRIVSPVGQAVLGLAAPVRLGQGGRSVVFDLGVGYALRFDQNFDQLRRPEPARPTGEEISQAPLDLGRMPLHGLTYRLGLALRP